MANRMTERDIRNKIKATKLDERFRYKPALVQINAPLALIQVELATVVRTLRWVLGEKLQPGDRVGPIGGS